jgi:predicted SnoaL-like aldol condensation-catalyzing enzyme
VSAAGISGAVRPTELINRFYDEMFAGNFAYALVAADPAYRSHTEACEVDPASLLESCRRMIEPLGERRREVLFEFNDGDLGVVVHRCTGRMPDGSPFSVRSADVYRVRDGRLLEHWGILQSEA